MDQLLTKIEEEEETSSYFACCAHRKKKGNTIKLTPKSDDDFYISTTDSNIQLNRLSLCKELEDLLPFLINEDVDYSSSNVIGKKDNYIAGWWIYMIISTYSLLRQDQKAFVKEKLYDPRVCVKKN